MLTKNQILDRSKTVTRRMGWTVLKPGELIQAIEKGQGLEKGEKVNKLAVLRVEKVSRERLGEISRADVDREGFTHMTTMAFILMFCDSHKGCVPTSEVTRIEFSYVG